ncbi:hypothetical protein ACMD2_03220 [Ananas comosus]|uniref:Uncharacterized protein n=1 Tax=Ananas comosus TaxID=4615 RepID=A0A199VL65_ANACO|nr:hypothetical protein ACMD2_03220 [Ananas comosus]
MGSIVRDAPQTSRQPRRGRAPGMGVGAILPKLGCEFDAGREERSTLVYAVDQDAEKSFKKTVEADRLIDMLRDSNPREEKIESATDVLKAILHPVMDEHEEISWPPRDPEALKLMEKELVSREQEGQLDEGFLSEVNAQLRQAKEDGDKPGLEAMLQKVLQLYASRVLRKRSYAYKGGEVLMTEKFLESIIEAPENNWNKLLLDGLTVGKGQVPPEDLYSVIKKRIERILIRTEGGSYQQRILIEYLKGIQSRAEEIVKVLQGPQQ